MATSTDVLNVTLLHKWAKQHIPEQYARMDALYEACPLVKSDGAPAIPVDINLATGASHDADIAEANASQKHTEKFLLDYATDFAALNVRHFDTLATQGPNAVVGVVSQQFDNACRTLMQRACYGLYGDGTNTFGALSGVTGSVAVLPTKSAALRASKFKGSKVVFADSSATGALRDSGDTLVISTVNVATRTVTFTTAVSNISGLTNGDHMLPVGDAANGGVTKGYVGLTKWMETNPGTLFGLNRANYPRHLVAGTLSDQSASGLGTLDALKEGLVEVYDNSDGIGDTKKVFLRASEFNRISNELTSVQHHFSSKAGETDAGHAKIRVSLGAITAELYSSPFCPEGEAFVLDTDPSAFEVMYLHNTEADEAARGLGLKPCPQPFAPMNMGNGTFWNRSGEQYKAMLYSYMVPVMHRPSAHGRIILP